jgi:hypothetical protein
MLDLTINKYVRYWIVLCQESLSSSSFAFIQEGMPTHCSHTGRKAPQLTYRQRQLAREVAQGKRDAINTDVDRLLNYIEEEANALSKKHKRSVWWFLHQLYQGGRIVRPKQRVNIFNAAQQVDGFLEGRKGGMSLLHLCYLLLIYYTEINDEDRSRFLEIQGKLTELKGVENVSNLPDDMKDFLRAKAVEWRQKKHKAPR